MPLEFVSSQRGQPKLKYEGYFYCKHRESNGVTTWRCDKRACKATATTSEYDDTVYVSREHMHPASLPPTEQFLNGQLGDLAANNQVPISMVQPQRSTPPSAVEAPLQMDLAQLMDQIQCSKWLPKFQEQDVDINVFYTMTDNDLKEIGINLLGPRRKMTTAIARHHQNMAVNLSTLEQTYANKLQNDIDDINKQLLQANCTIDQLKTVLSNEQEANDLTAAKLSTCENLLANCYKKLESSTAHNQHLLAALLKLRSLNSDSVTSDRQAFGKELDNLCQHLSHILTQVSPSQTSSSS